MEHNLISGLIKDGKLEKVAGGYVFGGGNLEGKRWEVISDSNGNVLGRYATRDEAIRMANAKSESDKEITGSELRGLRKEGGIIK